MKSILLLIAILSFYSDARAIVGIADSSESARRDFRAAVPLHRDTTRDVIAEFRVAAAAHALFDCLTELANRISNPEFQLRLSTRVETSMDEVQAQALGSGEGVTLNWARLHGVVSLDPYSSSHAHATFSGVLARWDVAAGQLSCHFEQGPCNPEMNAKVFELSAIDRARGTEWELQTVSANEANLGCMGLRLR